MRAWMDWLLLIPAAGQELPPRADSRAHRHLGLHSYLSVLAGFLQAESETGSASGLNLPVSLGLCGGHIDPAGWPHLNATGGCR